MTEPIIVRVTLGSYDVVHPSEKQTQVYAQIPEVGRASWLLDEDFYGRLKNEPWPHVIDEAHNDYMRRGVVSDSASEAGRKAIVDWLLLSEGADYDERFDAVQAAWEAAQARQHPVARKLLAENERLRARVAELEAANAGLDDLRVRALDKNTELRTRITELEAERHSTNKALDDAGRALREKEQREAIVAEFVAARAEYITAIRNCHPDNGHDYDRWQGHAAARRQLSELLGLPVAWPEGPTPDKSAAKPSALLAPSEGGA